MQGSSLVPSFIYNKAPIFLRRKPVFGGDILRCKQLRQICSTVNLINPRSYNKKLNFSEFHEDTQCTYTVTVWRVHGTTVAMETQQSVVCRGKQSNSEHLKQNVL